jgi:hypothetical protein
MITHRLAVLLGCALCLSALGRAGDTPVEHVEKETIYTDTYGTVTQLYRAVATEADLGMPIWRNGQLLDSGVFRVRDRKDRDMVRYAFARVSITQRMEVVAAFYLKALGGDARRETDKDTGEVMVFVGDRANSRVVRINPKNGNCHLLLEHVEHFAILPREYTEREQQVARVVEDISRAYRQAGRVAYTMEQQVVTDPPAERPAPVLTWKVDFRRPRQLTVNVSAEGMVGLDISTRDDKLIFTRPEQEAVEREFGAAITSDAVPELRNDPVARLVFGDVLLSDDIDYLALLPVGDAPLAQQVEVVLTFPEDLAVLHLQIDRLRQVITRAVTVVRQDGLETRVIRTYHDTVLEPAAPATLPQNSPTPSAAITTP